MRNLRWQFLIAIGGVILVVGLLIGQTPDADTVFPQPAPGGIYVEALVGDITRLNPILDIYNQTDRDIDRLIFSGLVRFDSRGVPHPDLADWAVTADATLYTFTIREDAFWHDGEPVTSDDVVYTFSKLQDPGYPGPADLQAMWQDINIIWLDSRRVQFQLPEPFAPFLDHVAIGLLPDHLLRGVSVQDMIDHPFNLQPIGTGPFRFDQFIVVDEEIEGVSLVAFNDYYAGRPFLERVEFQLYDDTQSAFDAYLAGEVLGIGDVDLEVLPQVLQQPDLNLHTARLPQLSLVFLNTKHAEKTYLGEKTFRQALLLSINRQWIINQALAGQGLIPYGPVQPGTWAFSDSFSPMPFDQIRASELLDSLGWELPPGATPGTPEYRRSQDEQIMSLELIYPEGETHAKVAEILKTSWQAVGIEVELVSAEPASVLEDYLIPREYDAVLTDLNLSRFPDPDPYPFWHDSQTETGQNYSGFTDRNISIWLEQARITPDFGRRAELYRNFQHRFQDQSPALLLYYPVYNYAINAQVQGVSIGPLFDPSDRFMNIAEWYVVFRRSIGLEATQEPASLEIEE
jgi:peptide/nickel transport system substrate-binding protein